VIIDPSGVFSSGGGLVAPPPDPTPVEPLAGGRANREADLFWSTPATGAHERLPGTGELPGAADVWRERMRAQTDAACLHVTAGEDGAELYALPFVPAEIARERERFGAYATRTMGGNLLGDLVQDEVRKQARIVAIDAEAVAMAPFGARSAFQLLLAPRVPRMRFEDDGPTGAALLEDVLGRLARRLGSPPVALWVRTAPQGAEHFCWRIDVLPRLGEPGGLELGSGLSINSVTPEQAASELREA
jgi:UDPglucose--hexose-1-phosphate uridylyltransferase